MEQHKVLGLEQGLVRLHAPTPAWVELYIKESALVRVALAKWLVGLEHIGSTSIPNIKAKPILDIMVGINRLADGLACKEALEALGYSHASQIDIENDIVYTKGGAAWTHLLHVVEFGSRQWLCNLRFRDRLRNEPELAQEYEHLKEHLSQQFSNNRSAYTKAKADFIQSVVSH